MFGVTSFSYSLTEEEVMKAKRELKTNFFSGLDNTTGKLFFGIFLEIFELYFFPKLYKLLFITLRQYHIKLLFLFFHFLLFTRRKFFPPQNRIFFNSTFIFLWITVVVKFSRYFFWKTFRIFELYFFLNCINYCSLYHVTFVLIYLLICKFFRTRFVFFGSFRSCWGYWSANFGIWPKTLSRGICWEVGSNRFP